MDAIDFLERMGADARLLHGAEDELHGLVTGTSLDPDLATVLATRDGAGIYRMLGQGAQMAVQVPAEEEEAPDEDEGEGERKSPDMYA
jgi:hypothetical protein